MFLLIGSSRWYKYRPRWGLPLFIRPRLLLLIPNGDSVRDSLLMVWQRFMWTWIPKAKPFLSILCGSFTTSAADIAVTKNKKLAGSCMMGWDWSPNKTVHKKQKSAVSTDREYPFSSTRLGLCFSQHAGKSMINMSTHQIHTQSTDAIRRV